ncbi:C4-dicarboxylate TRAP transporter substrate-binding protein [uncultured Albimonas sp.]|uniref:C4-dicarboxylate TRAP transporter substrate-binding protein n=1 Tax=uncultured Albimonas sp. TaxID=1331701 RepID=UPI0030EC4E43
MNTILKAGALACALLSGTAAAATAEMTLRYVEGSPNRGAKSRALTDFGNELAKLSNGELEIEFHWGGALLKWGAIFDGVAAQTADMGTLIAAYNPKELQGQGIGDLPIGESGDAWVGSRALHELLTTNADMIDALARQNIVFVGAIHTTANQVMCKGADIKGVADLKGKKYRGAGIYSHALSDYGATIVNLTYGESYQALDTGLVDCSQVLLYSIDPYKFWEIIDQVLIIDWGQTAGIVAGINKDVHDRLSDSQREALRKAGDFLTDRQAEYLIEEDLAARAALEAGAYGRPVEVIHASAEDEAILDEISKKYIDDWKTNMAAQGYDADAAYAQYLELLDKYARERDEKGYPWTR